MSRKEYILTNAGTSAPTGPGGIVPVRIDRDDPHHQSLIRSLPDSIPGMVYRGMPDWSLSFVLPPGIEFLPKPYGPASLARRVRQVLNKI